MKKFLSLLAVVLFTGCTQTSENVVHDDSSSSSFSVSSYATEVRSIDDEWNEYMNHSLGFSIAFPKRVLEDTLYDPNSDNPSVPVEVIENGEIITFSRGYSLDLAHLDSSGHATRGYEDLSVRRPYFSLAYLDEPHYAHYPYQIYVAEADSIEDVGAFMRRAYGDGCTVDEDRGRWSDDLPGALMFTVGPEVENCPGYYPVGDVVTWYRNQKLVVGEQPGWDGNFAKPYLTKKDENRDYDIVVNVFVE